MNPLVVSPFHSWPREFFNDFFKEFPEHFRPSYRVEEFRKFYQVEMDLPGVKKKDIHLEIEEDVLTVKGERKIAVEDIKGDKAILKEKSMGTFSLQFTLPRDIDFAQVKACYEDGVLSLKLSKKESKKSLKKIQIQ